ncbi:MAG: CHAP domain-containing protein, partial [Anaerolineae bacterium]|nr:CHAP domain-containing protein [Anaerolineae bacterium]
DDSQTSFPGSSGASNGSSNGNPQNDGTPGSDQSGAPGQSGSPGSQSGPGGTGGSQGHSQDDETNAAGIPLVGLTGAGLAGKKDDEEEEPEDDDLNIPEYVSAANRPLVDELIAKHQDLEDTQNRLTELLDSRTEKAAVLERLQAAALNSDDKSLLDRIDQLKKDITDIDTEMYYANDRLPGLQEEVDALQKRVDLISLGPDADLDAIRKLEGGETSQWIRDATHNEDNTVNCVNYIVNRMAIPGELPLNAHLWDDQAIKFADKYGIKVGTVPLEGSVIVMEREHSYANDIYGHVMYVEKVEDGIVWVTDNTYPDKLVRLDDLTTELSGPYIKYLYFPWQTQV